MRWIIHLCLFFLSLYIFAMRRSRSNSGKIEFWISNETFSTQQRVFCCKDVNNSSRERETKGILFTWCTVNGDSKTMINGIHLQLIDNELFIAQWKALLWKLIRNCKQNNSMEWTWRDVTAKRIQLEFNVMWASVNCLRQEEHFMISSTHDESDKFIAKFFKLLAGEFRVLIIP